MEQGKDRSESKIGPGPALRLQLLYGGGALFGDDQVGLYTTLLIRAMFSENSSRCDSKEISFSCLFLSAVYCFLIAAEQRRANPARARMDSDEEKNSSLRRFASRGRTFICVESLQEKLGLGSLLRESVRSVRLFRI
jgi:hypothetical protein